MTANRKLFAVLFVILAVLLFVSWSRDKEKPSAELQTARQAVISSQTRADGANRQYILRLSEHNDRIRQRKSGN